MGGESVHIGKWCLVDTPYWITIVKNDLNILSAIFDFSKPFFGNWLQYRCFGFQPLLPS